MMELSRHSQQMRRQHANSLYHELFGGLQGEDFRPRTPPSFSHSPESEFVEVNRLHPANRINVPDSVRNYRTEIFNNPNRSSPSAANERFRNLRERRLRELYDRRQNLVSQIEHLRSARELLYPADPDPPTSPLATPPPAANQDIVDGIVSPSANDHTYIRTIDEVRKIRL